MDEAQIQRNCELSYGKNVRLTNLMNCIGNQRFNNVIEVGCREGYLLHNIDSIKKTGYDHN